MENNTVILDLHKYNELYDFKNKIEEDYSFVVQNHSPYGCNVSSTFMTTDEAIENIVESNSTLVKEIERLSKELNEVKKPHTEEINKIKKMSVWEFLKWRKSWKK